MTRIPINKWVHLSIRKHIKSFAEDLPLYFEEQIKDNNLHKEYLEVRIDGPWHSPFATKGENKLYLEVNILCSWNFNQDNTIGLIDLTDVATWALNQNICIYKLGDKPSDDKSFFETMLLIPQDEVKVANFGQIDNRTKFYQATVEAHYELRYVSNGTIRP